MLDASQEGLNFVPQLSKSSRYRSSGSSSHRSNGSRYSARNSIISYNGNYEGDTSMFGNNLEYSGAILTNTPSGSHLLESDSDTEIGKELERYRYSETSQCLRPSSSSPSLRLWNHFTVWLLTEQRVEQLTEFTEQLRANFYYQELSKLARLGSAVVVFVLRSLLLLMAYIGGCSYGLWRSKTFLRQVARRLLWSMTLAKCDDASFFGLILLAAPLLFVISVFGFLLSLYCTVKGWLSRSEYFIRDRVF